MKKKCFLFSIIFILSLTLFGCKSGSLDEVKDNMITKDFVVEIKYSIITEHTNKFLFFDISKEEKEDNKILIEKKNDIYYLKDESNNLVECSDAYFFWFDVLSNDYFDKTLFRYNADLIEINNQISLNKSGLYGILLRNVILSYGDFTIHSPSNINEFTINVSNNNLNEVELMFYLFTYNSSNSSKKLYLSMNYSFKDYK